MPILIIPNLNCNCLYKCFIRKNSQLKTNKLKASASGYVTVNWMLLTPPKDKLQSSKKKSGRNCHKMGEYGTYQPYVHIHIPSW
jgi:hypothetical protein